MHWRNVVGRLFYSMGPQTEKLRNIGFPGDALPCLTFSLSRTLCASNFSTPCIWRICMTALLKPHLGASGVPFMNTTSFFPFTRPSMCSFDPTAAAAAQFEPLVDRRRLNKTDLQLKLFVRNEAITKKLLMRPFAKIILLLTLQLCGSWMNTSVPCRQFQIVPSMLGVPSCSVWNNIEQSNIVS